MEGRSVSMKRKLGILSGILLLTSVAFLGVQSAYASKGENWEITGREITTRNEGTEIVAVSWEEITDIFVCVPTPAGQGQKTEQNDKMEKDNDVWEVRSFPAGEKNLSSNIGN